MVGWKGFAMSLFGISSMGSKIGAMTLCTVLLSAGLTTIPVAAQERSRSAVETLLGGSFFPFRRSFAPPSPRCQALAERLKDVRDDDRLTAFDVQTLRRKGCGGAY